MSKFIFYVITFIAGLTVKHFYELYKNRIQRIQFSTNKIFLGTSADDNLFGKVEILHNDIPVENLYLCDISLVNTTNTDFENIQIVIWCDLDSEILRSFARNESSINVFKLTEEYLEKSSNIEAVSPESAVLIHTRRPYDIQVLNRDDRVKFSCLVTNNKGKEPHISLDCEQAGLKLEENYVRSLTFWGENQSTGAICGIIISALLMIPTFYFISSKLIVSIVAFVLGVCCLFPGVLFLKILKKVRKAMR